MALRFGSLLPVLLISGLASAEPPKAGTAPAAETGPAAAATPSGTTPPPSAPAPPSAVEAQQIQAAAAYNVKLRDLERKVNELKEQVFRSKARLNLLKETVLHGVIAGARSAIVLKNEMGGMYVPIKYTFALDGTEIYSKSDDSGRLGDQKEIEIYNGSITPGNHTLSVQLVYQGNAYGVFAYLKGYKFTARSSHTFTATEGKQLQLKVVGFEKGNPVTTDPKDRPAIDFREAVTEEGKPKPADGKNDKKADTAPAPGK
jgi:hypothetical protein